MKERGRLGKSRERALSPSRGRYCFVLGRGLLSVASAALAAVFLLGLCPFRAWAQTITITEPPDYATVNCTAQEVWITGSGLGTDYHVYIVSFDGDSIVGQGHSEVYYTTASLPVDQNGNLAETLVAKWDTLTEKQKQSGLRVRVGPAPPGQFQDVNMVTVDNCVGDYFYVYGGKGVSNLTGTKADIECVNVTLSNEQPQQPGTHSVAATAVNRSTDSTYDYAEVGWLRANHIGNPWTVARTVFYSLKGGGVTSTTYTAVDPGTGDVSNYKAKITATADGRWTFYRNDVEIGWSENAAWQNQKGTSVVWQGEIYRKGTDMPGTGFANCQYQVDSGAFTGAGLTAGDMDSDDCVHWEYNYISGTNFQIGDAYPLQ